MGKFVEPNVKYHYVMRYKNSESANALGMEILEKGLSTNFSKQRNIVEQREQFWTL